jgi:N-acetylglucosaminyldiphosphoundecaprenol N-acetyl-beta-D-mannosaminyltransferase
LSNPSTVDFHRNLYCVLGVPVDACSMEHVIDQLCEAAKTRRRLFLSTPNLNFIVAAQRDPEFRQSLLLSDLCPVDGMGALVICRMLGLPTNTRVAGSDIPREMAANAQRRIGRPFRVALFGGDHGVAEKAQKTINDQFKGQLECVEAIDPGFMTPDKMHDPATINRLNEAQADFLLVALGAAKGQAWILRNMKSLNTPAISHLGATINFIAGTVSRAPALVQKSGMEWLWRIKEEPKLASRYLNDGTMMGKTMLRRVLPLAHWLKKEGQTDKLQIETVSPSPHSVIGLTGNASGHQLKDLRRHITGIAAGSKEIDLDVSRLSKFDMEFAGIVLLLEQHGLRNGVRVGLKGANPGISWAITASGLGHVLV